MIDANLILETIKGVFSDLVEILNMILNRFGYVLEGKEIKKIEE